MIDKMKEGIPLCIKCKEREVINFIRDYPHKGEVHVKWKLCGKCKQSPDVVAKSKKKSMNKKKTCRFCGTNENLAENNLGRMSICVKCLSDYRSEITSKFAFTEEFKEKQRKSATERWKNMPEDVKMIRNKNVSNALTEVKNRPEQKEKMAQRSREWWKKLRENPEAYQAFVDKNRAWTREDSEKKKQSIEKMRQTKLNKSPEEKKEAARKCIKTKMKNSKRSERGTFISKGEMKCMDFLMANGFNVKSQAEFSKDGKTFWIDFYLPDLDLFCEYNGVYWHGYNIQGLKKFLEMRKTPQGENIVQNMKNDRWKRKNITNLITITDKEFKENPQILLDRIRAYGNNGKR